MNGKWISKIPIPSALVILGENVRMLVSTLCTEQRLSYSQIQKLLKLLFNLEISEGEISKIQEKEAKLLSSSYEALKQSIRQEESVHMDETGWKVKGKNLYGWIMTGQSEDAVFELGKSRGGGVAKKLYGASEAVAVTDDYNAYKNLAKEHQLCFAHLIRKFRDLAEYPDFPKEIHEYCLEKYKEIKNIFKELSEKVKEKKSEQYLKYFSDLLLTLSLSHPSDGKKMSTIKNTLRKNISSYLTCLFHPSIDLTNNRAERGLRHLVVKRRISFGSDTAKGADTLAVLLSVLGSLMRRNPNSYFEEYGKLRGV